MSEPSLRASVRRSALSPGLLLLPNATNPDDLQLDGFTLPDSRASIGIDRYKLSRFVQNAMWECETLAAQTEGANPIDGSGARAKVARPRTFGLTLGAEF